MRSPQVSKLLALASDPLAPAIHREFDPALGQSGAQLHEFLMEKNGCLAFESALYILPRSASNLPIDQERINDNNSEWKKHYYRNFSEVYIFSADIFGGLFGIRGNNIVYIEPETGEIKYKAANFNAWCDLILREYRVETGWLLAHEWQEKNGILALSMRLVPKIFFVMGGAYSIDNLYEMDMLDSLCLRGDIASQIRDIPDGHQAKLTSY